MDVHHIHSLLYEQDEKTVFCMNVTVFRQKFVKKCKFYLKMHKVKKLQEK